MSSNDDFHLFNLDQRLIRAIADLQWKKPTDIQQSIIPLVFEHKSIVVHAKTGSGKTAAFSIPIVHELLQSKQYSREQQTTVLILTPSKELCNQATRHLRSLCKYASQNVSFINISQYDNTEVLRPLLAEAPDIVISTPARLVSHLRAGHLDLSGLRQVLIDEADLIFTFGHQNEMQELKHFLPSKPLQVVLLSATLDDSTKVLRRCLVKGGEWVKVELMDEAYLPSDRQLVQYIISSEDNDKYAILITLLKLKLIRGKTIIFTNSVDRCYKLRLFLEEFGIRAALLNSELPVMSRCHTVDQFNRGLYDYLLATDECNIGADKEHANKTKRRDTEYGVSRGIDFHLVSNVINFDFPSTPALYVHRVGRTARADQMGSALSFVSQAEEAKLAEVDALLNPGNRASVGEETEASTSSSATSTSVFRPYQFRLSEVDGFRYRSGDVLRGITRKFIREARLKEIKQELLNSERLKGYFEDHTPDLDALRHDKPLNKVHHSHLKDVPEYLVPASLRPLLTGTSGGRRPRVRWRKQALNIESDDAKHKTKGSGSQSRKSRTPGQVAHTKKQQSRKNRARNPLFSFGKSKRK